MLGEKFEVYRLSFVPGDKETEPAMKNPRQPKPARVPKSTSDEPGKRWLLDRAFKLVRRAGILEVLESLLGGFDERAECCRLMDGHVGQNLAVDLDASLVEAVDEAA